LQKKQFLIVIGYGQGFLKEKIVQMRQTMGTSERIGAETGYAYYLV
jgi:hypothetical protein